MAGRGSRQSLGVTADPEDYRGPGGDRGLAGIRELGRIFPEKFLEEGRQGDDTEK